MTTLDDLFRRTQSGEVDAFSAWVRRVEPELRRRLRPFARVADVEAVIQEALLRMWKLAPTLELTGENASMRYLATIARNLAAHEARRWGAEVPLVDDQGEVFEIAAPPTLAADLPLRAAILECLKRLSGAPARALRSRLEMSERPDRELAVLTMMKLNTFLQNVVRARRAVAACLDSKGIRLEEVLR